MTAFTSQGRVYLASLQHLFEDEKAVRFALNDREIPRPSWAEARGALSDPQVAMMPLPDKVSLCHVSQ